MSDSAPLFDHEFGLSQLGGNKALLDKMLSKFAAEFNGSPTEILGAIEAGDYDKAKIRVHTTKGISGNLGLQAVYQCASEFDAQLREKQFDSALFEKYTQIMKDTCEHIASISQDTTDTRVDMVATDRTIESGKAALRAKLERNEFIDDDSLVELVSSIKLDDDTSQKLIMLIEELKYAEAIKLIE